jgi:arginyl-tRNA synthetase
VDFDLTLAVAESNENPVYYVQYSHARICSILAKAEAEGLAPPAADDPAVGDLLALLDHPSELALLRKILEFEEQIDLAVDKLSPHNLTYYAMDLASVFNGFYRDCKVVDHDQPTLSRARLLLSQAARIALARVLILMGMSTPETM